MVHVCIEVAEEFTRPTVDAYNNTVSWRVAVAASRSQGENDDHDAMMPRWAVAEVPAPHPSGVYVRTDAQAAMNQVSN